MSPLFLPPSLVGQSIGRATSTTPFTLPTAMTAYPGLSVAVNVAAGTKLRIECDLPDVLMGSVATTVALRLRRDGTELDTVNFSIAANLADVGRVSCEDIPPAGAHVYDAAILIAAASAGAASQAGPAVFGLYNMNPELRVVVC